MASRKPKPSHHQTSPAQRSPDAILEAKAHEFLSHYNRRVLTSALPIAKEITKEFPQALFGWKALGTCLMEQGSPEEATQPLEKALAIEPNDLQAQTNLAKTYIKLGKLEAAQEYLENILVKTPQDYQANVHIGDCYAQLEQNELAIKHLNIALEQKPSAVTAQIRKANALVANKNYDQALEILEPLVRRRPNNPNIRSNLANLYATMRRFTEAETLYNSAVEMSPDHHIVFSNYYFTAHYNPAHGIDDLLDIAAEWDQRFAPLHRPNRPSTDTTPDRQLRIGLVSSGLRTHPVGQMITSAIEQLDQHEFSLYAYSNKPVHDSIARRIQARVDTWRDVAHLSDPQLAEQIRADGIDILIDMTGHTSGNRLKTMTEEPAPLIAKWVGGLFNTMGVKSFDYLISDHIETPAGVDDNYFENLIRLPDDYICFVTPSYAPAVSPLPAQKNGVITFGCFNNPAKLNDTLLTEWATLLKQVPHSRLFLKGGQYTNAPYCEGIYQTLADEGISRDRVILEGPVKHQELMETYNRVDIALDPWPYSGGLTTCEALLMGVPVVTLPGPTFAGRHSATHLVNAGMPELVTSNWEEYRQRATELASDLDSLANIRRHLRDALLKSPVCDAPRFARHLTTALRAIWQRHCEGRSPAPLSLDKQGTAMFEGDELAVTIVNASPSKDEMGFRWQFGGKVVAVDNGSRLLHLDSMRQMLEKETAELITFDPASQALQHPLKSQDGVHYFPNASLGDGQVANLHACLDPASSGTLAPVKGEAAAHEKVSGSEVIARLPITTITLDSIEGLPSLDWLALDANNDSTAILEHGAQALQETLLLQASVVFQPRHEHQPDLAQISHWAARHGFRFYKLSNPQHASRLPKRDDISESLGSELVSADALFIPSHQRMASLSRDQRMKLAFIAHSSFGMKDLSFELIQSIDSKLAEAYLLQSGVITSSTNPGAMLNADGGSSTTDQHHQPAASARQGVNTPSKRQASVAKQPSVDNRVSAVDDKIYDEVIFVVGCGHSGTTLMASILGAHPEVYSIARETYWFLNNPKVDPEYVEEKKLCLNEGKRIVCEKTPRHIYRITEIQNKFPNAKFVAMLRDSRDVVGSLKNRSGLLDESIKRWLTDNTALLKHADNPRVHWIKYEDLVTKKEQTMQDVFKFLELNHTDEVFEFHKKNYNWFGVEDAKETNGKGEKNHLLRRSWQMTQPIHDRSGVWKKQLTEDEVAKVISRCSDIMLRLGYPLASFKESAPAMSKDKAHNDELGDTQGKAQPYSPISSSFKVPEAPHMSLEERKLFKRALRGASSYFEFGSGGSTVWAVKHGLTVYGVESDAQWVEGLADKLGEKCKVAAVDIGPTREWGHPISDDYSEKFPSYSSAIHSHKRPFDLILVDGRFRVACVIAAVQHLQENHPTPLLARIFIHDFWDRPAYHSVLEILEEVDKVDTAGLFRIKPNVGKKRLANLWSQYAKVTA